jgi:hypothetical protein
VRAAHPWAIQSCEQLSPGANIEAGWPSFARLKMACRWESEAQHTHTQEQANLFSQVGQLLSEGAALGDCAQQQESGANLLTEHGANFISFKYPGKLILLPGKRVRLKRENFERLATIATGWPSFSYILKCEWARKVLLYSSECKSTACYRRSKKTGTFHVLYSLSNYFVFHFFDQ